VGLAAWHLSTADLTNYRDRLREAGLEPVDLTCPGETLGRLSGLVIPGGRDVDPALYNQRPHPETQEPHRPRDDYEIALLREALRAGLPVLAICRGLQVLNVALGGSLLQHIESGLHESQENGESQWHDATLTPASRLRAVYGSDEILVNSRHHQAVTAEHLAPGLRPTARTADGMIEGMESETHSWVVAVQWHPERLEPGVQGFAEGSGRLFRALSDALKT
jgi:putative glutamine amidotransferase